MADGQIDETRDEEAQTGAVRVTGKALAWTDEEIARLTGIDDEGNVHPAVLADAKADARRYAALNAFLTARPIAPEDDAPTDG